MAEQLLAWVVLLVALTMATVGTLVLLAATCMVVQSWRLLTRARRGEGEPPEAGAPYCTACNDGRKALRLQSTRALLVVPGAWLPCRARPGYVHPPEPQLTEAPT